MPIPDEAELRKLHEQYKGNLTVIAEQYKRPESTIRYWYKKIGLGGKGIGGNSRLEANRQQPDAVELPDFGDDDIATPEIIDHLSERFQKRFEHYKKKQWFPVKVNIKGPIGISFIGDPHVDDNGCNWPLLRHHCELHEKTEGLFAVNIGDTENNWIGRLMRLYADQDTSRQTAHKLTKWFLRDSGMHWLVWLMGNHDLWGDLSSVMRAMNIKAVPMEDWQARWRLVFPNKRECRIWTAHNFQGHSMWNSLHGPQKAAHMKSEAHIYACGHTHNWAIHQEESASRDFIYWLVRSRGYKYLDEHAQQLGHMPQQDGASITCIINPEAETDASFVQSFADMDMAVDYLNWLRK